MYAYLTWAIFFGLIWMILYVNRKDLRFEMIFSSLLFLPFGLTQPLFVPEYWDPIVIFRFLGLFDIESLLWCFFSGGIAAVLYEEIFSRKLRKSKYGEKARHHAYVVYIMIVVTVVLMLLIKHFTTWSVLRSSFIIMILVCIYFIVTRHDLLKESLIGGIFFTALYIISLLFIDFVFPGFVTEQWTMQGGIGIKIFSIVIEEYLYAFLFGMVWSVVFEEIKNIKLNKK